MASMNYKKVREIKANDWNVNILGVVKFFRPPTRIQKTGDYQMMITIIDESVGQDVEAGIRCNIFESKEERLPQVKKVGDIIILKQMKVKMFNSRLQVQKTNTYQWAVFGTDKNQNGNHYINIKTSSLPPLSMTQFDRQRLRELLEFLDSTKSKIMESEKIQSEDADNKITLLSNVKVNTYIDVIVKVIDINRFLNSSPTARLLKVSDGTNIPFNSLCQMGNIESKETSAIEKVTKGSSCDISVFDEHVDDVEKLKIGDVIRITNLHVKAVSNELLQKLREERNIESNDNCVEWAELIVHSGRKYNRGIKIPANDNPYVASVKERIVALTNDYHVKMVMEYLLETIDRQDRNIVENNERVENNGLDERSCGDSNTVEPRCLQESLTTTDFPLKPFTSIRSLKCSQGGDTNFRVRAKVLCIKPKCFTDMIIGKCGKCEEISKPYTKQCDRISLTCPTCKEGSLRLTYLFRLLLEDETGLLHVIACGDDALYFFNNMHPVELIREPAVMSNFEQKLAKFDNYEEDIDLSTIPLTDVCVKYSEKSDTVKYWMFGTSLI